MFKNVKNVGFCSNTNTIIKNTPVKLDLDYKTEVKIFLSYGLYKTNNITNQCP